MTLSNTTSQHLQHPATKVQSTNSIPNPNTNFLTLRKAISLLLAT